MTRSELLERAKPILFNTDMVRAILGGRKTVTRRVIKLKYGNTHIQWHKDKYGKCLVEMQNDVEGETYGVREDGTHWQKILAMREIKSPYRVGDILYVQETWCIQYCWECDQNGYANDCDIESANFDFSIAPFGEHGCYIYYAENDTYKPMHGWKPSIHMPKEAARIFLRVTGIRMERLQDIDDDGVVAEGLEIGAPYDELWNSTVKKSDLEKYGWNANPWVWVIEFERVEVTK